jgi:hypothetical protein
MSLTHFFRIQLLLLFALLQCVAPLAHAHVNGDNADSKVHLDIIDSAWLSVHDHDTSEAQLSAELAHPDHSAVVSMPPEYRYSDSPVAQISGASVEPLLAMREYVTILFAAPPRQSIAFLPHLFPCSQAPPVKIAPVKIV